MRLDYWIRCEFSQQFLLDTKVIVSCLISIPQMHLQQESVLLIKEVMQFYQQVDVLITTLILLLLNIVQFRLVVVVDSQRISFIIVGTQSIA